MEQEDCERDADACSSTWIEGCFMFSCVAKEIKIESDESSGQQHELLVQASSCVITFPFKERLPLKKACIRQLAWEPVT
jgi:hypothetical protein